MALFSVLPFVNTLNLNREPILLRKLNTDMLFHSFPTTTTKNQNKQTNKPKIFQGRESQTRRR